MNKIGITLLESVSPVKQIGDTDSIFYYKK